MFELPSRLVSLTYPTSQPPKIPPTFLRNPYPAIYTKDISINLDSATFDKLVGLSGGITILLPLFFIFLLLSSCLCYCESCESTLFPSQHFSLISRGFLAAWF